MGRVVKRVATPKRLFTSPRSLSRRPKRPKRSRKSSKKGNVPKGKPSEVVGVVWCRVSSRTRSNETMTTIAFRYTHWKRFRSPQITNTRLPMCLTLTLRILHVSLNLHILDVPNPSKKLFYVSLDSHHAISACRQNMLWNTFAL